MVPDDPGSDLHRLWVTQQTPEERMSTEDIRKRAHAVEVRIGRRNLREYLAGAVVVVAFSFVAWTDSSSAVRLGAGLVVAAAVYVMSRLRARGSVRPMPGGLGLVDCRAFYRSELLRQRDLLRGVWSWYLLPFVPGMLTILIGRAVQRPERRLFIAIAAAGVAAAFVAVGWLNGRVASRIQRRIDELE